MKQKILSLIIILMVGTQPLFPFYWEEDTLTKEVDFSNEVDDVEQEGEAWCVYASMEAVDGMEQCTHCFNYIHSFLVGKDDNVYGSSYIPDEEYKAAMKKFNEDSNSTCTSKETFSKFGVAGGDNRFFESEGYNNNWNIGLSVSYPLSSLFKNGHKIKESQLQVAVQKKEEHQSNSTELPMR